MINITFPDGSVKQFEKGATPYQIAESISPRLASEVLVASVNDHIWDLDRPIDSDSTLKLHKWDDDEAKKAFWHSSSHLMAEALQAIYPGVKFGIGPAIDMGKLAANNIGLNRKVLADLAMNDPQAFEAIVNSVK